jgi:hypothetical protein
VRDRMMGMGARCRCRAQPLRARAAASPRAAVAPHRGLSLVLELLHAEPRGVFQERLPLSSTASSRARAAREHDCCSGEHEELLLARSPSAARFFLLVDSRLSCADSSPAWATAMQALAGPAAAGVRQTQQQGARSEIDTVAGARSGPWRVERASQSASGNVSLSDRFV